MPVIVNNIDLPKYPNELTFNFTERVNLFVLENHSYYNVECSFDDETEFYTLEKKMFRRFDFPCSKIKFKSYAETPSHLEILSIFGDGFVDIVDKDTVTPHLLRIFKAGDILKEMVFDIQEAFEPSFTLSVGSLGSPEDIIKKNLIKTAKLELSKVLLYNQFSEDYEVYLEYYGGLSIGRVLIYTE
jgi:hypothetical protein